MSLSSAYSKLLSISEPTFFRLKKKHKKLFKLLDRYFNEDDILEFYNKDRIDRFENQIFLRNELIENNRIKYLDIFMKEKPCSIFYRFYFQFLIELRKSINNEPTVNKDLFNPSFYLVDPLRLANTYLTIYTFNSDLQIMLNKAYRIQTFFPIFKQFDSYMLFFIKECINNNFEILFQNHGFIKQNKEACFHIASFYLFNTDTYKDIDPTDKVNIAVRISNSITHDDIVNIEFLKNKIDIFKNDF